MKARVPIVAALLLGLAPVPAALAQQASPPRTDLEQQIQRKRHVVRPPVVVDEVARDAARAEREAQAERRREELVREVVEGPRARRPDLRYDVTSGIQARNLQNARRR